MNRLKTMVLMMTGGVEHAHATCNFLCIGCKYATRGHPLCTDQEKAGIHLFLYISYYSQVDFTMPPTSAQFWTKGE